MDDRRNRLLQKALTIARANMPSWGPSFRGLILNYSVHLYENVNHKERAFDLAQQTFDECATSVNSNSPASFPEA
jgi:hypothetical protein